MPKKGLILTEVSMFKKKYALIGAQYQLSITFCSDFVLNKTFKDRNSTNTHRNF